MTDPTPATDSVLDQVRVRYAAAALAVTTKRTGACCGTISTMGSDDHPNASVIVPNESGLGASQYDTTDLDQLPLDAVLASLGCGNPIAVAELQEGQTVLDLGSGGGIDVLLSARRVGLTGRAFGLDMTDEMLDLARANAVAAGATNVEFVKGHMEAIPLPDASIDVVISNCVVNLSRTNPLYSARSTASSHPAAVSASATWSPTITSPSRTAPVSAPTPTASQARSPPLNTPAKLPTQDSAISPSPAATPSPRGCTPPSSERPNRTRQHLSRR